MDKLIFINIRHHKVPDEVTVNKTVFLLQSRKGNLHLCAVISKFPHSWFCEEGSPASIVQKCIRTDCLVAWFWTDLYRNNGHCCPRTRFPEIKAARTLSAGGHVSQDWSICAVPSSSTHIDWGLLANIKCMKNCGMLTSAVWNFADFSFRAKPWNMLFRQTPKAESLYR